MLSFKQYLKEDYNDFEFWPEEDALDWAIDNGLRVFKKYSLNAPSNTIVQNATIENGMLNGTDVMLTDEKSALPQIGNSNLRHLPFQFGKIKMHFFASDCNLGSLKGSPITVGGKYSVSANMAITSFEYLPQEASAYILRGTSIKSFSGVHKVIKRMVANGKVYSGQVYIPATVEKCLLGFLKIPGCKSLELGHSDQKIAPLSLIKACDIITKHLQDNRNIIACQEELFQNNLDEYAKL